MSELQLEMMDPELSADYERLMELQTKIDEENQTQESLLERMMGVCRLISSRYCA